MAVGELTNEAAEPLLANDRVNARRVQLFSTAVVVVIIDQITKQLALSGLADGPIEGPLGTSLRLVFNRGSAFSLGEGFGPVFGIAAIVVTIAMYWLVKSVDRTAVVIGLGFIAGGAIGNVIDRAFRDGSDRFLGGAVIDFLEIGSFWPVFNIADVAIVVGGAYVALKSSSA